MSAPSKWYHQRWAVVVLLFLVLGPFGLPLLWKSPAFSRNMKIALSVAVVAYSAMLVGSVLMAVRAAMNEVGLP